LGVGNYCYVSVCLAALGALAPTEGAGAYRGGRPPTACLMLFHCNYDSI